MNKGRLDMNGHNTCKGANDTAKVAALPVAVLNATMLSYK